MILEEIRAIGADFSSGHADSEELSDRDDEIVAILEEAGLSAAVVSPDFEVETLAKPSQREYGRTRCTTVYGAELR